MPPQLILHSSRDESSLLTNTNTEPAAKHMRPTTKVITFQLSLDPAMMIKVNPFHEIPSSGSPSRTGLAYLRLGMIGCGVKHAPRLTRVEEEVLHVMLALELRAISVRFELV